MRSEDEKGSAQGIADPLEPINRVVFVFNDKLYFWVLKPVKTGYSAILPKDIRVCLGNFASNLATPVSLINSLFQGRWEDAGITFKRFGINTVLGVYGFADSAASEFGLTPRSADFGQTLGVYCQTSRKLDFCRFNCRKAYTHADGRGFAPRVLLITAAFMKMYRLTHAGH